MSHVPAQDGQHFENIAGFPSEVSMAVTVLPLPEIVNGKLLLGGTKDDDASNLGDDDDNQPQHGGLTRPCRKAGQLVKFSLEHQNKTSFGLPSFGYTYQVVDQEDADLGVSVLKNGGGKALLGAVKANLLASSRFVVLEHQRQPNEQQQRPIMLVVQERPKLNKAYDILSATPMFPNDPAVDQEENVPFYPMFKVRDIDDNHLGFRSLLCWNGKYYQPYLHIVNAETMPGRPESKLLPTRKNNLMLVDMDYHQPQHRNSGTSLATPLGNDNNHPNNKKKVHALFTRAPSRRVKVCVAPGVDVGMCLALAFVLDDMVGWFA